MRKILSYLTAFAVLITSVTVGILPANATYPACGPVKGGNTTFLVCNGRQINHFWSGTKIKVRNMNDDSAELAVVRGDGYNYISSYYKNQPEVRDLGNLNGKNLQLTITYLGRDTQDPNRALIKVDSNATYEDSLDLSQLPYYIYITAPQVTGIDHIDNKLNIYWSTSEDANYYNFEVEKKLDDNSYLLVDDVDNVYNTVFYDYVPSSGNGDYRLKVRAINSQVYSSEWSEYYYFSYNQTQINIPKPTLTVSEPYYNNGVRYVSVAWDQVGGDYHYKVALEYGINGVDYGLDAFNTNAGPNAVEFQVSYDGYYRVMVSRYSGDWNNSVSSDYVYFTVGSIAQVTEAPTIILPENGWAMIGESNATIRWTSIDGFQTGSYELELYKYNDNAGSYNYYATYGPYSNSNFNYDYNDFYMHDLSMGRLEVGIYRVRIRAYESANHYGNWSGDYFFQLKNYSYNESLATPVINYPANNQKIYHDKNNTNNYGFDLSGMTLYTTWNDVNGANYYEVSYERYDNNTWNNYGTYNPSDNRDMLSGWIDTGSYRVRVRTLGSSNQTSPWSDWTYFEVYNHGNQTTNLGDVTGTDGIYVGYTGMAFTHDLTNIHIKVVGYDENYVVLEMENAVWNKMYVKRGDSYQIMSSSNNRALRVYFDNITSGGIDIHLETIYPQAV